VRRFLSNYFDLLFNKNPSHLRLLLPTGLPDDNGTGADLSRSSFYYQFSHLFVYSVWWTKLSGLPVSFLLHVKYTSLSYRIVSVKACDISHWTHSPDIPPPDNCPPHPPQGTSIPIHGGLSLRPVKNRGVFLFI